MAQKFEQGDRVRWDTPQGETYRKVKERLTSPTEVGGQKVNASDDDPRYVVESGKSGKEAAHKPDSLSETHEEPRWQKTTASRPHTSSTKP